MVQNIIYLNFKISNANDDNTNVEIDNNVF